MSSCNICKCDDALAVGRQLPDIVAAVLDAERLDPFRFVLGQIFVAKEAAVFAHERVERAGDFAAIEGIAATGGDCLERCGEGRIAKCLAVLAAHGRSGGKSSAKPGCSRQTLPLELQPRAMTSVTGKPSRRVANRGRQDFVERQLAEAAVELGPAIDATGHAHRERTEARDVFQLAALEFFERETARAAAAGVEAVELFRFGVPDDGEQVAAEAAAHGFGDAEDGVGGDGGVDRVAAGLQDFDGGERRERLARGRHAVFADGGRAGGE